ncbi:putative defense protein 3 [Pecten maximus]|uniref:putative defense protein 3 n=1 Tax=Pecten maximus TaxID=6579 RepID=UPI0014587B5B|nr:putative defense protein 3 [Pecten maximus]
MAYDQACLILSIIFLALLVLTNAFPFGETEVDCKEMKPSQLTSLPQRGPAPYNLSVSMNMHGVGMELIVTVKTTGSRKIRGILIQARSAECPLPGKPISTMPIGSFTNLQGSRKMKPINCSQKTNSTVTNRNWGMDDIMEATWKVAETEQRKIRFYATVVDDEQTYWVGIHSEVIRHISDTAEDDGIACQTETYTPEPVSTGSLTKENSANMLNGVSTLVITIAALLISIFVR